MKAVIQRVTSASLSVAGKEYSRIDTGILALIAVEKNDCEENADRMLESIMNYRIFSSQEDDRMTLSLLEIKGDLMLVSQFTLAADTKKGRKPSFSAAAEPAQAKRIFDYLLSQAKKSAREKTFHVTNGKFGAMMNIGLVNEGPVTFILER